MAGRDPTRIAETLRGVAAGTTLFRISPGQARTISAGILLAAADVADELATVIAERDRAMHACEQIGAQLAEKDDEIAKLRMLLKRVEAATRKGSGSEAALSVNGSAGESEWSATILLISNLRAALLDPPPAPDGGEERT